MFKQIRTAQYLIGFKLLFLLLMIVTCPLAIAQMPSPEALLEQLGISQNDKSRLHRGETVLFNVDSSGETELTAGVIIYIAAMPQQISALIAKDGLASLDTQSISGELIPVKATVTVFNNFNFSTGSREESEFIRAIPNDQFNLSTEELGLIKSKIANRADIAVDIYKHILWQRWQSYRLYGLKGIAPYDRGNNTLVNPSVDLQTAALEHDLASDYFPELFNAWYQFPNIALPKDVEDSYTWINRLVENRPTAILTHRFIVSQTQGELILARQFYAGHSFKANQLTIMCLPYEQGALIFYTNRNFTDQVLGIGSNVKHFIGVHLARTEVIELLTALQKHFQP